MKRLRKVRKVYGFGGMGLHSECFRRGDIFGKGVGCQRDDGQRVRPYSSLANSERGFLAIAIGHSHIHQDEIERAIADHAIYDHRDRFVAIMRDGDALVAAFEHLGERKLAAIKA